MTESRARILAGILDNTGDIKSTSLDNVSTGLTVYATLDDLPTSGLTSGQQAFVTSANRVYVSNGSGWYSVALFNATPRLTISPSGAVTLAVDGSTPTVITLTGTDSDNADASLVYSVESDGSFANIATLSQDSSVFTITPLSEDSATPGSSTLTFKVSDGVSFGSGTTTFSLTFGPDWTVAPTESKLTASDGATGDGFGSSVSLNSDGTYFIAGAPNDDDGDTSTGSAYVFTRSGSTWTQQAKLTASGAQFFDQLGGGGAAFNTDATYVIVGAIQAGAPNAYYGAAYVFTRSGSTWTQQAKLTASDVGHQDQFGKAVAINSDATYAIVGAPFEDGGAGNPSNNNGAAYIYYRVGSSWSQQARLPSFTNAANAYFGESVSMSSDGTYVAVGARGRYYSPSNLPGLVYIYTRSGSTWTLQAELVASDNQTQDFFGKSVSMNPDATYIIIGAQGEDTGGSDAGAAYVFTRSGSTWTQQAKLTASDAQATDYFGYSVSINSDGTFAAVGAHGEDGGAGNPISSAGAIYTFKRTGSTWTQQSIITASDASTNGGYFAMATSISGDGTYIAASAQYFNSSTGAAYIYEAG